MLLVTGASGLLGTSILLTALASGFEVVGLANSHPFSVQGAKVITADLTNATQVCDLMTSLKPSIIIHCAAATNVDWCEDHPHETDQINVIASSTLAELALKLKARFVYISTDSVFDGDRGSYVETDEPAPLNHYAKSKLQGEQAVSACDPAALIARVNIYGWNAQSKQSLAEWVLDQLRLGKSVPGFTDVYFNPILVNDLAELLLAMLDRGLSGIYHVVGSEKISKHDFAQRVAAIFGFEPTQVKSARLSEAKMRAPRPLDTSLLTDKVCVALGRSVPDVNSGLSRFRDLYQNEYPQRIRNYFSGAGE